MRNKSGVIILTILISLLCVYYLSFTFISRGIQKDAIEFATEGGEVNRLKKQQYLDSVWNEPVYNLLGFEFTYKKIKESELNLGLDLQGGMHVTLEVSPVEIIKGLSGNSKDAVFLKALDDAAKAVKGTQLNFVDEFYRSFSENNQGKKLADVFVTVSNNDRISLTSTDEEVLELINEEVNNAVDRSFNILRTRVDRFGTSQPNIQKIQGTGRIQIELPGIDNPQRVRKLLQGVAKLEFWEVYKIEEIGNVLYSIDNTLSEELKASSEENDLLAEDADTETGDSEISDLFSEDESGASDTLGVDTDSTDAETDSLLNAAANTQPFISLMKGGLLRFDIRDTARVNNILRKESIKDLIPSDLKLLWDVKPFDNATDGNQYLTLNPIKVTKSNGKAPLEGDVVTLASQEFNAGVPYISMTMNTKGARAWQKLTGANVGRSIAIVLDNYVYSAPNVNQEISGGSSSIEGSFTVEEATDLANILKAGSLPAPTTIVEDVVVGPTLGEVARDQGIISIFSGLAIVILFMIAYYSKGGMVANLALFFNVFFILGILANLNAALTLPGIAGIVLTIGMSIDANVLIFERIKEELRNGTKMKQAIASGYSKAFSSIVDANVTTFLTGIILYVLGQGPVKGFAITLMIGIACSFFSAVFITRVVVEWISRKGDESKISFSTPFSKNALSKLNINFIGKRRMAYLFSTAFISLGIIAMFVKGLTLGVDFKGGRSFIVSFPDPIATSQLEAAVSPYFDNQGTEAKTYDADNIIKVTTSYLIDDDSDEADLTVRESLIKGVSEFTGLTYVEEGREMGPQNFTISSSSKVSGTIAEDIKDASYKSALFALIAIFLYIILRFRKWQFGLGAIIALAHDTLFVISAFAIANLLGVSLEVDQVFVAAILTIIGYSINDTVVVFDRIRENLGIKSGKELVSVFNESLNNTISRTLITSVTTLIVILILLIFGGTALRGFSFALLVGVLIGTYSSIFIATPVVIDFAKKKAAAAN
ncbi:MAG: protein translocase subunit SecDF [Cyclobacteriaceae bacterium]